MPIAVLSDAGARSSTKQARPLGRPLAASKATRQDKKKKKTLHQTHEKEEYEEQEDARHGENHPSVAAQ